MCPGLSGTVLDFGTFSLRPGKYEIVLEILKNKVDQFLRPIKGEGFVALTISVAYTDACQ